MERVIKKDRYGNVACNDIYIYSINKHNIGKNIGEDIYSNWEIINQKYYRYTDDNTILEIWYNNKGILLSRNLKGYINDYWTSELREEITYKEAMYLLDKEQRKKLMPRAITDDTTSGLDTEDLIKKYNNCIIGFNYTKDNKDKEIKKYKWKSILPSEEQKKNKDLGCNNKDLMSRVITNVATSGLDCARDDMVDAMKFCFYEKENKEESQVIKQNNNGGASDWYSLPEDANTLQDLIEHRNMNGSVKDIFKACYRLGIKTEDALRDLNKMAYYSLREVGRITGRKDYITIAKELMGSQAIEKDKI